jgi:argininosuccinate synthase
MNYAAEHGIAIEQKRDGSKSPYSMDANLLHISYEGYDLEDPWVEPGKRHVALDRRPRGRAGPAHRDRADLHRAATSPPSTARP